MHSIVSLFLNSFAVLAKIPFDFTWRIDRRHQFYTEAIMVTRCMHHWVLIINLARDLFISLPKVELNWESPFHSRFDTKIKSDLSVRFDTEIKSDPEIGLETKPNLTLKLGYILKLNMVLELGFRVKIVCIQNFKLILNILEHSKPSVSSLK